MPWSLGRGNQPCCGNPVFALQTPAFCSHRPIPCPFPSLLQNWGRPVIVRSSLVSLWNERLSLKKDLLPLECRDKKTFSNFPWKLQNTHRHPGSEHSPSPAAGPSEALLWFSEGWWQGHVTTVGCAVSFMFLGSDKSLLQPVSSQHTEWEIKGQYQTQGWAWGEQRLRSRCCLNLPGRDRPPNAPADTARKLAGGGGEGDNTHAVHRMVPSSLWKFKNVSNVIVICQ